MHGRFVWHELMTSDVKGAIAFYTEVIGWKTEPFAQGQGPEPYMMWVGSQGSLGGVMPLSEQAKNMGVPPHWVAHVEVNDVDATVAKVRDKGGNIHVPPTNIPTVGRFSVIVDPQGAALSVFKPKGSMEPHDVSKPGEFTWNELYTTDSKAAFPFYSQLFGWEQISEMDMGPAGKYLIFGQGSKQYGGMMTKTPDMPMPPSWIYYVHVDDIEATMKRATSKGAKPLFGPMEIPDKTLVAQLMDPQGAIFALHGPGKTRPPAA